MAPERIKISTTCKIKEIESYSMLLKSTVFSDLHSAQFSPNKRGRKLLYALEKHNFLQPEKCCITATLSRSGEELFVYTCM